MPELGSLLLDSSIVIAHFRGDGSLSEQLIAAPRLYLPVIALGELHHGARKSQNPERKAKQLQLFLTGVIALPVDVGTAWIYGEVRRALARAGTPIPDNDVWIAALAREYELPLVARDAHFDLVAGLRVLRW